MPLAFKVAPPSTGTAQLDGSWNLFPFAPAPAAGDQGSPATSTEGIGSFLTGAVAGDFSDDNSWSALAGQIVAGLIPVYGQLADARDTAAAAKKIWNGEQGGWGSMGASLLGWVPLLGDTAKGAIRGGKKVAKEVVGEATEKAANEAAQKAAKEAADQKALANGNEVLARRMITCFAAGTPLLTPDGEKAIEELRVGDLVLAAPEDDPEAAPGFKRVEQLLTNSKPVMEVGVGGQVIRTTAEHPFWVRGQGWVGAGNLRVGDQFRSHDEKWHAVESVSGGLGHVAVYNVRVGDYPTYFVGRRTWGFSVWAHNSDPCEAGENILKDVAPNNATDGVVYKRTNPKTGEEYIGQAKSPERFDARQGEHDAKLGVDHDYEVMGRAAPGKDLDVLEESLIRQQGGIQREGGTLANRRHQMSEPRYRAAGGQVGNPN